MNRMSVIVALALLVGLCTRGFADFPIRASANHDVLPALAHNSVNHEYLVVWTELMSYSVMGQRLGEDGAAIESPFLIYSTGSNPSMAWGSSAKYAAACRSNG